MRHVLEALGFTDEGTLRGFMPNGGGPPRDYEMYAVTKDDWTRKH
jgi:RimJ/RimL family protein N-acetyltransferase